MKQLGRLARVERFGREQRAKQRRQDRAHRLRSAKAVLERARRLAQRLELHRRLPFVLLLEPHAEKRRRRVEQAADAGRLRDAGRGGERRDFRRERRIAESAPQASSPRPSRAKARRRPCARARARRGRRPASGSGARWPRRRQRRVVEQHQLAAPGAAVVAIAIAVERDAEHGPVDLHARRRSPRHARRDAGRERAAGRAPPR